MGSPFGGYFHCANSRPSSGPAPLKSWATPPVWAQCASLFDSHLVPWATFHTNTISSHRIAAQALPVEWPRTIPQVPYPQSHTPHCEHPRSIVCWACLSNAVSNVGDQYLQLPSDYCASLLFHYPMSTIPTATPLFFGGLYTNLTLAAVLYYCYLFLGGSTLS